MIPRLVPKILPLDAFSDRVGVAVVAGVGIGNCRSWMPRTKFSHGNAGLKPH